MFWTLWTIDEIDPDILFLSINGKKPRSGPEVHKDWCKLDHYDWKKHNTWKTVAEQKPKLKHQLNTLKQNLEWGFTCKTSSSQNHTQS